jgi:hemoglobin-like flavoprotein
LGFAISSLDNIDILMSTLEDLGRRHCQLWSHRRAIRFHGRCAVVDTNLEQRLGRAWTPAAATAWTEAYGLLAAVMRAAAER